METSELSILSRDLRLLCTLYCHLLWHREWKADRRRIDRVLQGPYGFWRQVHYRFNSNRVTHNRELRTSIKSKSVQRICYPEKKYNIFENVKISHDVYYDCSSFRFDVCCFSIELQIWLKCRYSIAVGLHHFQVS